MFVPLSKPRWVGQTLTYRTKAREKRAFHSVLDAKDLFVEGGETRVSLSENSRGVTLDLSQELRRGRAEERTEYTAAPGLAALRLERRIASDAGPSREEIVDFAATTHTIPACTYVDVNIPFLLGGMPFDHKARAIYAWICDRFVAKVYYESRGAKEITVPAGRFRAREVVMYPDLNDWVKLGSVLTTLSKPFIPKYHMWFEEGAPHRLVTFEGPHGPPGAPEIVLELERATTPDA